MENRYNEKCDCITSLTSSSKENLNILKSTIFDEWNKQIQQIQANKKELTNN